MLAQKQINQDPTLKLILHRKGKKEEKTQGKHKEKVYWNKNNLLVR
jgi:hypothetical protein